MDIYRFFHPHHNPRLHNTPLRLQELSELLHAAAEIRKALERAKQRLIRKPVGLILPDHFTNILKAATFIEDSLDMVCNAHPGDGPEDIAEVSREREGMVGWERWVEHVNDYQVIHKDDEKFTPV